MYADTRATQSRVCASKRVRVCAFMCVHACLSVRACVCVGVCVFMFVCARVVESLCCTFAHGRELSLAHTSTQKHSYVHTYARTE